MTLLPDASRAHEPLVAALDLLQAAPPEMTVGIAVIFAIIAVALIGFVFEVLPVDVTALGLMVLVIVLEPWTRITPYEGLAGFSSPATITVLAMFILSEGIRRTGVLQLAANKIVALTGGDEVKQFAALIGITGATAGFINNTPVVAMMVPMVINIAKRSRTSPSTYLIPVSFAAIMGGTLTLIGTSTTILASDISARLLDHPFSMFEFTPLGILVLLTGWLYLLTLGRRLTPQRIKPEEELTDVFALRNYLTEAVVQEDSPFLGERVGAYLARVGVDIDIVRLRRDGETFAAPLDNKQLRAGDTLIIRADRAALRAFMELSGFKPISAASVREADLTTAASGEVLVEVIILADSPLVGETVHSLHFVERFNALVLALRRGPEIIHDHLGAVELRGGDTLLVQTSEPAVQRLSNNPHLVVTREAPRAAFRTAKMPLAIGIVATVILLAALEIVPILVAALGGVIAMVMSGCVRPSEMYEAVNWNVIFLLAGVIPLGMALEQTGGAAYLAYQMTAYVQLLPPLLILVAFYLITALITQVISNNASVVLMIPVAINVAAALGANPFAFVLVVTFAASTALLTPVGYQTNLMVYGPGGYRFTDFFRVGAVLQLLLAAVTSLGVYLLWGV